MACITCVIPRGHCRQDWSSRRRGSLGLSPSEAVTVRVDSCAAVLRYGDGGRALVGTDGAFIVVNPAEWIEGATAIAHVDATFPAHRVVTIPVATTPLAIDVPPPVPSAGLAGLSVGKLVGLGLFAVVGLTLVIFFIASLGSSTSRVSVPSLIVWSVIGYRLFKRWSA